MKPLEHSSLQCIYCDDIREEINGKTTIVGWYDGSSTIVLPPEDALTLPSLCIVGLLTIPFELKIKSFALELRLGEKVLQSIRPPTESINAVNDDREKLGRQFRIALKSTNFKVSTPCALRLYAMLDDVELYSNGLYFSRPTAQ